MHRNSGSQGKEEAPVAAFQARWSLWSFSMHCIFTHGEFVKTFYFFFDKCVRSGLKTLVCGPLECLSRSVKRRSTLSTFAPYTRRASR